LVWWPEIPEPDSEATESRTGPRLLYESPDGDVQVFRIGGIDVNFGDNDSKPAGWWSRGGAIAQYSGSN
jgi:hypothetical protein